MSRFNIVLSGEDRTDTEAYIGYDRPLRSFFLQAFWIDSEDFDIPEIWLGTSLGEFPTLESLVEEAKGQGYKIRSLDNSAIVTMLSEAGHKPEPSLGERLGIVF